LNEITLTKDQYEHLPYKDTKLTKDDTFGAIVGLLRKYGIKRYMMDGDEDEFTFVLTVKHLDMERNFPVKISVPHLMYYKPVAPRSKKLTLTYLENESWRVAWWYLKAKLDAITYGISDGFKEFMPNIYHALPDGKEVMLSDIILNAKKLGDFDAIEDQTEGDKPHQIDADFKVIGEDQK
jgi:hypothetical protein